MTRNLAFIGTGNMGSALARAARQKLEQAAQLIVEKVVSR